MHSQGGEFGTRFADYLTGQWQNHCKYKKGR